MPMGYGALMSTPVDLTPDEDAVRSISLPDGAVLISLGEEVTMRGNPSDVARWAMKVASESITRLSPDEVGTFVRSMMLDMTAKMFAGQVPDELEEL